MPSAKVGLEARMRHEVTAFGLLRPLGLVLLLVLVACGKGDETGSDRHGMPPSGGGTGGGAVAPTGGSGVDLDAAAPGFDFGNVDGSLPPMFTPLDGAVVASLDGGGEDPDDDDDCGSVVLEPMVNSEVQPGTVLVVFDDSGSMSALWGDRARWVAAGEAIRDSIGSLAEFMTVGAIIFPSDSGCGVDPIETQGQIRFLPGASFLTAWDRFMTTNVVRGSTPLGEALLAADAALQAIDLDGQTSVVVLTDGEPNCDNAPLMTLPPMWLAQGIKTHVVGLPGSESAVALLDQIAAAGGTDHHISPDDPRTLRKQLASIVGETVISALPSCTIPLDPPAPNPDDVHLVISADGERHEAARDLDDGGGWRINDDGDEIELYGNFCDQGLAGAYDRVSIEFGCLDLPPLEPPTPVI
jgi:hypothetical protein